MTPPVAKGSWQYRGFGLGVEVPDWFARPLRRVTRRRQARSNAPVGSLLLQPPPTVDVDARERERAQWRALAVDAASHPRNEGAADEIESHPWYHTIEFPDGSVTNGRFDHRPLLPHYGIPTNLNGARVLDVGSGDGFWALEFERRGGLVTSLDVESFRDVDLPPALHALFDANPVNLSFRRGLELARKRLDSQIELVNMPIYELAPEKVGTFDVVHAGDILLHLRDPILALQRIRSVTSGKLILADVFDPVLDRIGPDMHLTRYRGGWEDVTWWAPALSTLTQMVADAGFDDVSIATTYQLGERQESGGYWRAVLHARG
jgi:tRNA (mo5U34)-methyltransferase